MSEQQPIRETRVMAAHTPEEQALAIAEAVAQLKAGQVVVFPTDTVYGVGCDLWQPEAIDRLYEAKQRPHELPIPVLISSVQHISRVAQAVPRALTDLALRFWPGGLTVILSRRPEVPEALGLGQSTVAVRMPNHPLALALIQAMGGALAVTSANISGAPTPSTAVDGIAALYGRVALALDGGDCPGGVASTIIDLSTKPARLLRAGPLNVSTLRQVLPDLEA